MFERNLSNALGDTVAYKSVEASLKSDEVNPPVVTVTDPEEGTEEAEGMTDEEEEEAAAPSPSGKTKEKEGQVVPKKQTVVSLDPATIQSLKDIAKQLRKGNQLVRFLQTQDKRGRQHMIAELLQLTEDGKITPEEKFKITTKARDLARLQRQEGETEEAFQERYDGITKGLADEVFDLRAKRADPDVKVVRKEKAKALSASEQRKRIMKLKI